MAKKVFLFFPLMFIILCSHSQTLFSYGAHNVSKNEFLTAFNKNSVPSKDKSKAIKEYLELYTRFKLKVQAAKDMGLDTLEQLKNDMANYRLQVMDNYLTDESEVKVLVNEAIERSWKDEEVAHIFIQTNRIVNNNSLLVADTAVARKKAEEAFSKLKAGEDFGKVAAMYSDDVASRNIGGRIGYITVFTLPYEMENIIYNLKLGEFSSIYRSKGGFHIFKKLSEREALGKFKGAQILLALPPGPTTDELKVAKAKADSLYNALQNGASFSELAKNFSDDKFSFNNGGVMPEIAVGDAEPDVEKAIFSMKKNGEISKPILSSSGYHIFRRDSIIPVSKDKKDVEVQFYFTQRVKNDPRIEVANEKMQTVIFKRTGYKKNAYNEKALWDLTDSAMSVPDFPAFIKNCEKQQLFSFTDQKIYTSDWLQFVKARRIAKNFKEPYDHYPDLMKEYVKVTATEYYRKHLEELNPEFKYHMQEFKEGSLLFEVMERKIWSQSSKDTTALKQLYEKNRSKYLWEPSVSAELFTCSNETTAKEAADQMKTHPDSWQALMQNSGGMLQADSGRFEIAQLPIDESEKKNLSDHYVTRIASNPNDGVYTFSYIIKTYPGKQQRSFDEARGLVINDYQQVLEENWINSLKKKYPVKVNNAVLHSIMK